MVPLTLLCGLLGVQATAGGRYLASETNGTRHYRLVADLVRSPNDRNSYRVLRLENRMEVLLVSSHEFSQAAVALDVDTGFRDDPPKAAGLAHLVEHLLFTGNGLYPEKDGFEEVSASRAS